MTVTAFLLERLEQLFYLAHLSVFSLGETQIPKQNQKWEHRAQHVFGYWQKGWKHQTDVATQMVLETLSFFPLLEREDDNYVQQPYGTEQQRAHNQLVPLPRLFKCTHHTVKKIQQTTAAQYPEHTTVRWYLWGHDDDQVPFRSMS